VLAHELAHSFVAIRNGIPVKSITLFFLGGGGPHTPRSLESQDGAAGGHRWPIV
jgi:Zn-dependent protease